MTDGPWSWFRRDYVSLRDWIVLVALVVGLLLLVVPAALVVFAVLTGLGALAAWKLSDWLAPRLPEEDDRVPVDWW